MLGAVAGDIIGSPYEWNNTNDRYFELCRGTRGWFRGREVTYHPKFTDDTVMTLAIARWLMADEDRSASRLIKFMQSMGREYIDRGFVNFKIGGRGMPIDYVKESYLYFLVKDEHQDFVRERIDGLLKQFEQAMRQRKK